ncbi:MAG: ChrR family anti-sigma-E factor [Halieaceae bacterium]|jgi:putative transcriptional regulator|nr:ChrR family anti-sigma-E factor [Halieaceae bacterium]
MVTHHPDTRLLNEFASGSLPLAQSACVSVHLHFCERCRRQVNALQDMGAQMFDTLQPADVDEALLDGVLAHLDDDVPLTYASRAKEDESPVLVQRLMAGDYQDLRWSRINKALQIARLRTGDPDNEFALYHIKAGGSIPCHSHKGNELTLVLEGSFSDEEGVYQQGDFLMRDAEDVHTPTASRTADCICIGVLDAPIRFKPWNYRLLNPFLQLQAS